VGWDEQINKAVSTKRGSRIFLRRGLDTPINNLPVGQIVASARTHKLSSGRLIDVRYALITTKFRSAVK
jgi:hypothetical protein